MMMVQRTARRGAALLMVGALTALGACSNLGSIGNVLGGVLSPQGGQLTGTVQSVDTRAQQIYVQDQSGQTIALGFDNQTQVTYQNKSYSVTSLERGDQVTARVQQTQNGGYYTDLVQVDQPVNGSATGTYPGSTNGGTVQQLQGTVRQVDRTNGWFTMDLSSATTVTVTMPYNPSQQDLSRFQSLRAGDYVRFTGVFLNNTRVELRQFY